MSKKVCKNIREEFDAEKWKGEGLLGPATGSVVEELRREARINGLCGSEEWTSLLNRAADEIALSAEKLYKADLFDYLCWLEAKHQGELPGNVYRDYLVLAGDGTTCWGKSYPDAVKAAMQHDKNVQDHYPPNNRI